MRQSRLFTKTRKEAPSDEVAKNAQLLMQAGYISKEMAGVYGYLPLGLRVQEKIKTIVRNEMNTVNGQELVMTALQNKQIWDQTGRWDNESVDVWFKARLNAGGEVGFGWSHEEPIGTMMKGYVSSYKDLPITVYQFQNKLRNELRAKSGIMRGREFVMKDAYSFAVGEKDHDEIYEGMKVVYMNVFNKLGIGEDTYITFASGGAFTEFSHEFQTVCEAGEDSCYLAKNKNIALNEEVFSPEILKKLGVEESELVKTKTAEVGNIFNFGRQKAEDLGLNYKDENGEQVAVWMGSYGIGITRVMGVIVEKFSDEKGLVWPEAIAPFKVHLVALNTDDEEVADWAEGTYTALQKRGVEVLFDDRNLRPGEKFADSDLLGIPHRVVVSKRGKEEGVFEVVTRKTGEVRSLTEEELFSDFSSTKSTTTPKRGGITSSLEGFHV